MNYEPDTLAEDREQALRLRLGTLANEYGLTRIEELWELDACLRGVSHRFAVSEGQIAAYRKRLGLEPAPGKDDEMPAQPMLDL